MERHNNLQPLYLVLLNGTHPYAMVDDQKYAVNLPYCSTYHFVGNNTSFMQQMAPSLTCVCSSPSRWGDQSAGAGESRKPIRKFE
jgi:hypothetical protein